MHFGAASLSKLYRKVLRYFNGPSSNVLTNCLYLAEIGKDSLYSFVPPLCVIYTCCKQQSACTLWSQPAHHPCSARPNSDETSKFSTLSLSLIISDCRGVKRLVSAAPGWWSGYWHAGWVTTRTCAQPVHLALRGWESWELNISNFAELSARPGAGTTRADNDKTPVLIAL